MSEANCLESIVVRAARSEDMDGAAALDAWAWPEGASPYAGRFAPFHTRFGPADLTVALDGRRHIGFIALAPRSRLAFNGHVGLARSILVAPDYRRSGVATALLTAAEGGAAARGFAKIAAHVLSSNRAGRALFAKAGYAEEGRLTGEYRMIGAFIDDVQFGKWLSEPRTPVLAGA
jgi:ribosomal protein S18 acetylase RimI-like enzyme